MSGICDVTVGNQYPDLELLLIANDIAEIPLKGRPIGATGLCQHTSYTVITWLYHIVHTNVTERNVKGLQKRAQYLKTTCWIKWSSVHEKDS